MIDCLSKERLEELLGDKSCFTVQIYDCIPSTNTAAKEAARGGAPEGLVIIADCQTGGYGRYQRMFYSPGESGLYMSLLLRPQKNVADVTLITTAAAVAVAEAIEEMVGRSCDIKWVNDLLLDGKKICGILTEGAFHTSGTSLDYAVLGIGINVSEPHGGFPEEIRRIAGAIVQDPTDGFRNRLAAAILRRFWGYYRNLDEKSHLNAYRKRLAFLGQKVTVIKGEASFLATALAVDGEMRLHVRYEDGRKEALSSGEIAIKL